VGTGVGEVGVVGKGLGQYLGVALHVGSQFGPSLVELHEPAAVVVLAVPLDLLAGLAVEHESEGRLVLEHLAGHVVSAT